MNVLVRDKNDKGNVSFNIGELVEINGAVFSITAMSLKPLKMEVSPANADGIRKYINTTRPENIKKPELVEAPKYLGKEHDKDEVVEDVEKEEDDSHSAEEDGEKGEG